MGIGCGKDGKIIVADHNETHTQQFLFVKKTNDISMAKHACDSAKEINKDLIVSPSTVKVENDFYDWNDFDFVVNTVDDRKTCEYVDNRCVWYKKALMVGGFEGVKGYT